MLQNASIYIRFAVTLILTVAFAVGFRPLSRKLSQKLSPKHPIAEQELIGLGIVPWFAGLLTDSFIMIFPNTTLAFIFISVAAPVGWGVIAFLWEPKVKKIWKVVLFQNLVSAVVFVLICVQMLGSGRFWPGILGSLSQMFHLPFLSLGARLTNWSGSLWPAYCAAFILMLLVSFIGCLISKRRRGEQGEKKRRTAMQMITWLLAGSLMGTWLLCMACLTVGTASYIFDDLCDAGNSMASNAIQLGRLMELYDGEHGSELLETCPGILEFRMLDAIGVVGGTVVRPGELMNYYRDKRSLNIYRDEVLYCDTAAAVFAPDGSIIFESGDFVSFSYISEEDYLAGDESHTAGYAWMDLNDETDTRYSRFRTLYGGTGGLYNIPAMRITGYLDGTRIEPFAISVINRDALYEALDSRTPDEHIAHPDGTEEISHRYTYGGLVAEGLLEWDTLFDYTDTAPEGKELITVYSFYHHM